MKKRECYAARQKVTAATMLLILTTSTTIGPGMAFAAFVDDWIAQKSSSGPSSYVGAQRGYYSGGTFSSRMKSSNDNLVSVSAPQLKIRGCGGIDAFSGGMSFLNVDFMVDKLQKVLAQAPAAAFDIALKTLAPQVAETIKTLTSMADKLNGLQMDDCKASKAIVATIASETFSGNEALKKESTSAQADFMSSSGANDFFSGMTKDWGALQKTWGYAQPPVGANPISDAQKASTAGCPAAIKSVFLTDGSLLENIAAQKGLPTAYIPTLRAFIGDVQITTADQTRSLYDAIYIPPCDGASNNNLMPFLDGAGVSRPFAAVDSKCGPLTDANANLSLYVGNLMTSIAGKMKTRTALTDPEKTFLGSMPLPISVALKNAVATKTESQVVGKLADITSKAFAYYMLENMLGSAIEMHAQLKHIISAQKDPNPDPAAVPQACNLTILEPTLKKMELVEKNTVSVMANAKQAYLASLSETQAIETFVMNMARFRDQVQQEISQQFGAPVARRATGG